MRKNKQEFYSKVPIRTNFVFLNCSFHIIIILFLGLRLERRIEEAVPAAQQLQELGMKLRCDDSSSEHVSTLHTPLETIENH